MTYLGSFLRVGLLEVIPVMAKSKRYQVMENRLTNEEQYEFACRVAGEVAVRPIGDMLISLTNGTETFALEMVRRDVDGPIEGIDARGNRYFPCNLGVICDHDIPAIPQAAKIWHDAENTETLWEVK